MRKNNKLQLYNLVLESYEKIKKNDKFAIQQNKCSDALTQHFSRRSLFCIKKGRLLCRP